MTKSILIHPNGILETPARPVRFSLVDEEDLLTEAEEMFETMEAERGIGLAGPQIGLPLRMAVVDCSLGKFEKDERLLLINPEVISQSGKQSDKEGCLSVPGFLANVERPLKVAIRYQDATGAVHERTAEGLLARAFLHEIDHLDGRLFLSRCGTVSRELIRGKIKKLIKAGKWPS